MELVAVVVAVAEGFVGTMNRMEHKAIALVHLTVAVVAHSEEVGIGVATGPAGMEAVVAASGSLGIVNVGSFGFVGFVGSFAEISGLAATDSDEHVVHVGSPACTGMAEDFELRVQQGVCC